MEKLNLTIIILTNRHDRRFKEALKSAQFAAEVLVIKETKPITDFAQARNEVLKKAKFNWVLFLDSDETIDPNSINQIKKIIKQDKVDGYYINRIDYFLRKKMNWGEVRNQQIIRLVKKNKTKFTRAVHEVAMVEGNISKSKIKINHSSHLSISDFFATIANYAHLEANFRNKIQHSECKIQESRFRIQLKIILEMISYPVAKFIVNFIFKLGLLDGWRGLIYAVMMSLHSLMVRVFLFELQLRK